MKKIVQYLMMGLFALLLSPGAFAGERGSADEAVALVKKAAAYLKANGKEKALAEFSNPKGQFVDRDMYVFAYNVNGDGINLAHGANPKMIGKNLLELKDADGKFIVKGFFEAANSKAGNGWVDYKWPNPISKAVEAKTTYIEKVGDILIGCGVYK